MLYMVVHLRQYETLAKILLVFPRQDGPLTKTTPVNVALVQCLRNYVSRNI